jgi:hypothetical protein
MEKLYNEETEDTPRVEFDKDAGVFSITGRSLPENAVAFYIPLLEWLKEYTNAPNSKTVFNFQLDYFNTASAKQLTKVLLAIQTLAEKSEVMVNWKYLKDDSDILASGMRFSRLIKANIQLIEIPDF